MKQIYNLSLDVFLFFCEDQIPSSENWALQNDQYILLFQKMYLEASCASFIQVKHFYLSL